MCRDRRMYLLAVESSTAIASAALIDDAGATRCVRLTERHAHAEQLMGAVDRLLREQGLSVRDLAGFAVGVGPGAFVGLRVGIATVMGLALGAGKTVVPVSTLEAMAVRGLAARSSVIVPSMTGPALICPMLDARRGQIYAACYRADGGPLDLMRRGDEQLVEPAEFLETVEGPALFFGDGAQQYRRLIEERLGGAAYFAAAPLTDSQPGDLLGPDASAVASLALKRWGEGGACDPASLLPVYYRQAVAQPAPAALKEERR